VVRASHAWAIQTMLLLIASGTRHTWAIYTMLFKAQQQQQAEQSNMQRHQASQKTLVVMAWLAATGARPCSACRSPLLNGLQTASVHVYQLPLRMHNHTLDSRNNGKHFQWPTSGTTGGITLRRRVLTPSASTPHSARVGLRHQTTLVGITHASASVNMA
jgi:hypothetical protein